MEILLLITGIALSLSGLFYAGLIGLFTFGWYRQKGTLDAGADITGIRVSVIIAARNEENGIADLLADIAAQDYPASLLEVLVVDDHSTDRTSQMIEDVIGKGGLPGFVLIKNLDGNGKKAAITAGVSKSTGDLIILTDADCRVGPAWISAMVSYFQDEKKKMVFGPVSYFPGKGLFNRFQSLEFSGLMASGAGAARAGHPFICNGANLAYRKEAFLKVRGYEGNEKFISGDDVFLMHKMKKEFGGGAVIFCKDEKALVKTYPAGGLRKFLNQRIRWASKSKGYKDPLSIITAIVVFSYSLCVLYFFVAGFFDPRFFLASGGLLVMKMITDFPLMLGITGFNGQRRLMLWYMPFQVVYPVYVVVAAVLSIFGRKRW